MTGRDRSPGARLGLVGSEHGATAIVCLACVGPFPTVAVDGGGAYCQGGWAECRAVMAQHQIVADAAITALVVPAANRARKGWAGRLELAGSGGSHRATSQTLQGGTVARMVLEGGCATAHHPGMIGLVI